MLRKHPDHEAGLLLAALVAVVLADQDLFAKYIARRENRKEQDTNLETLIAADEATLALLRRSLEGASYRSPKELKRLLLQYAGEQSAEAL